MHPWADSSRHTTAPASETKLQNRRATRAQPSGNQRATASASPAFSVEGVQLPSHPKARNSFIAAPRLNRARALLRGPPQRALSSDRRRGRANRRLRNAGADTRRVEHTVLLTEGESQQIESSLPRLASHRAHEYLWTPADLLPAMREEVDPFILFFFARFKPSDERNQRLPRHTYPAISEPSPVKHSIVE